MNIRATIHVPYDGWMARPHQMKLWEYLARGGKRAVAIWHRRAGKDEVALHHTAAQMMARKANYWHCLPQYDMARRAIWSSVNSHTGKRRIDEVFPVELRSNTDEGKMFIRMVNGSTWTCIGSDTMPTTGVGAGVAGVVFSEYALSNPSAWAYVRPMLEENNGWSVFISTPRGHNHCKTIYEYAQHAPGWFAELLTARNTGALSDAQLNEALKEMQALYGEDHGRSAYEQEYMCSFNALNVGSFYAREMQDVHDEGRIIDELRALPDVSVHRAWDLGIGDDTSIWFFQPQGSQIAVLHHHAASGVSLEWWRDYIDSLYKEHGWEHGTDYVPHDAKVRELSNGRTRVETMRRLGLAPLLVPDHKVDDGINAVRRALPLCIFNSRCEEGIAALEQYRREWDDEKKCFKPSAVHDWTSHPADSFRYLSMGYRRASLRVVPEPKREGWTIPPPPEYQRRGIIL